MISINNERNRETEKIELLKNHFLIIHIYIEIFIKL